MKERVEKPHQQGTAPNLLTFLDNFQPFMGRGTPSSVRKKISHKNMIFFKFLFYKNVTPRPEQSETLVEVFQIFIYYSPIQKVSFRACDNPLL